MFSPLVLTPLGPHKALGFKACGENMISVQYLVNIAAYVIICATV